MYIIIICADPDMILRAIVFFYFIFYFLIFFSHRRQSHKGEMQAVFSEQ